MKSLPQRKTIRLKGYDYSQNGCYFITICTKNRQYIFGDVINGKMFLNDLGKIAEQELIKTQLKRPYIYIDKFVIMPNHVHILMSLLNFDLYSDTARRVPTDNNVSIKRDLSYKQFVKPIEKSIPTIIRSYKSATTNAIRKHHLGTRHAVSEICIISDIIWQSRYHDHIVRNEKSYQKIYQYIENNPLQWDLDCHNPTNPKYNDIDTARRVPTCNNNIKIK